MLLNRLPHGTTQLRHVLKPLRLLLHPLKDRLLKQLEMEYLPEWQVSLELKEVLKMVNQNLLNNMAMCPLVTNLLQTPNLTITTNNNSKLLLPCKDQLLLCLLLITAKPKLTHKLKLLKLKPKVKLRIKLMPLPNKNVMMRNANTKTKCRSSSKSLRRKKTSSRS